ncbi:Antigen-like protein E [Armadillidium vulgare]|nr:Antigen-like protein E [Armadillidium vulgare]
MAAKYFNISFRVILLTIFVSIAAPTTNKYWIGASKSGEDEANPWVWLDGTTVQMGAPYWGSDAQLTECPDDFILISGSCFHFHYDSRDQNTKTSYSDAQTICSDLGARLAVFDYCTLFGSVATYINDNTEVQLPSKASYWIGANDIGTDGHWYWDGPYTLLQTGSPFWGSSNGVAEPNGNENQNCAVMYRDNQYYFHDDSLSS